MCVCARACVRVRVLVRVCTHSACVSGCKFRHLEIRRLWDWVKGSGGTAGAADGNVRHRADLERRLRSRILRASRDVAHSAAHRAAACNTAERVLEGVAGPLGVSA
jgi:hypothetical protein